MPQLFLTSIQFDDVHLNLALEEVLLYSVSSGEIPPLVRIWRNPESVIMGISRSIDDDLFIENIQRDSIPLARRASGGGTVYHEKGTFAYSFIFPWGILGLDDNSQIISKRSIEFFLNIVIHALGEIGFESRHEGISDIFIDDKKISGNAQKRIKGAILHHGTILQNINVEKMARYLKVPPERKGISHDAFVTSLANLGVIIDFDGFQELMKMSLVDLGYSITGIDLPSMNPGIIERARQLASDTYTRNDWIFRKK